jgi:acetyl-CoA synthetase
MSLITPEEYARLYKQSIDKPEEFWAKNAEILHWFQKWHSVKNTSFAPDVEIKWFEGGKLNASYNCIDRHLPHKAHETAIIWEGDTEQSEKISYQQLHYNVCKLANVLKDMGVKQGDVVTIYLPMIPQAAYAMLACARIGAIHSVVFAGFSAESLISRMKDCKSKVLIAADKSRRGGKVIDMSANVITAMKAMGEGTKVLLHSESGAAHSIPEALDMKSAMNQASSDCTPEVMEAESPLFILYTSGSTGKPKGVLHTTDYKEGDVFWCTADVGWITGHSYVLYGALANGAVTVMFEGVPSYPDFSRFWQVIDKHRVNIFYTAPTAIRALEREGDEFLATTSRDSLRVLGSVGEPINPEAWLWYYEKVGRSRCPIVDTWWQTETGGHMITPIPGAIPLKPGSATLPFFGIQPVLLDTQGREIVGEGEGVLCIRDSWPGQARTVFGDHSRFVETYFSQYPGYYFSGDGARRDADNYYWITGRVDDVLNVSGHRLGTAEIEAAINSHPGVAESAVVGFPHEIKGQGIYAFVILNQCVTSNSLLADSTLESEVIETVRTQIGPIAKPDKLKFVSGLPKTRSGKIMRRILRKIAEGKISSEDLGDTSTLLNPEVIAELLA